MGFLSKLLPIAGTVVGGVFGGGAPGAALGGSIGSMLAGQPKDPYSKPCLSASTSASMDEMRRLAQQILNQPGISTRPYDVMRKNIGADAYDQAQMMGKTLAGNMAGRNMSSSTYRGNKESDIWSGALAEMASRLAAVDQQQQQAAMQDRLNRQRTAGDILGNVSSLGMRGDLGMGQLGMQADMGNYGAGADWAKSIAGGGAFTGEGANDMWAKLRGLLSGGGGGGAMGGTVSDYWGNGSQFTGNPFGGGG